MASDDADKLVVPKFGSFTSKSTESPKHIGAASAEKGHGGARKSRSCHHDDGPGGHRSRDSHRHREHDAPRRSKESEVKREFKSPRDTDEAASSIFVLDTKGDPLIRRYGTIDKAQIPAYRRYGYGKVLGTRGRLIIYHEGSRDYFGLTMPGEGLPRYKDRDGLRSKRPSAHPAPTPVKKKTVAPNDIDEGFLSLGGSRKRKHEQGSSDEDEQPSYRSIEGKAKVRTSESDSDDNSDDAVQVDESDLNDPLKWKSIQLNKTVKEHPDNIDAWLELADHQDELLRAQSADGLTLDNETHSYKEIKVSMLESALENVNTPSDRERVLVELMREGSIIWPGKVAAKKWADLKGDVKSHALWAVQIDFMMTNVAGFQFDVIKAAFLDRLRLVVSGATPDSPDGFREAIYIFLRTTRFIHDAGYREMSVAAWQAMLELSFFRPDSELKSTSVPASFQDFWESEVSRIGDAAAAGWRQYVADGEQGEPPEPIAQPPISEIESRDSYKKWANLESEHAKMAKMPARTMDDGTEDDPFRVVTFSDIEPLLFMIPNGTLAAVSEELISAYLLFCGLPPQSASEISTDYYRDQFIAPSGCKILELTPEHNATDSEEIHRRVPYQSRTQTRAAWAAELLFSGKDWFRLLNADLMATNTNLDWVDGVLRHLVYAAKVPNTSEYYLAFLYARDPTSVKKAAKSLIKQNPDNTSLYNCYALAEFSNGNAEVAVKVLSSAASSSLHATASSRFQLYLTWTWMLLIGDKLSEAKRRLCVAADEPAANAHILEAQVSPSGVLKAHQAFSASLLEYLSVGDLVAAAISAECLFMLSYLTGEGGTEPTSASQGNISAAMASMESTSQRFSSRGYSQSPEYERVVQSSARLLYIHATRGPHRRLYMQEQLSKYITIFPSNTVLLSLYEWADAGMRIIDDTRHLLSEKVLIPKRDTISSRVFAIQHEISRGNLNTAKSAFEQALRSDVCKFNVMMWAWYVRFSCANRQFRSKAKDVFYRALRHCPWSKDIFMEAFITLIRDMKGDELSAVYNMMTAKGLRVHVDMEEFLENRKN